jgi:hypothetical protein
MKSGITIVCVGSAVSGVVLEEAMALYGRGKKEGRRQWQYRVEKGGGWLPRASRVLAVICQLMKT